VTGVAACGAIFTGILAEQLTTIQLPDGANGAELLKGGIVQVMALPPAAYAKVAEIYRHSIAWAFGLGVVTTFLALLVAFRLPELALKTKPGVSHEK
jgi:hypothetical protein